jgi:hypothetical protein
MRIKQFGNINVENNSLEGENPLWGGEGVIWDTFAINIIIYTSPNVVHLISGFPLGVWTNLYFFDLKKTTIILYYLKNELKTLS